MLRCYLIVLLFHPILSSFWNEIPVRCLYSRERIFSCRNTTFFRTIPLFNDLTYTFENHHVDIRFSLFNLTFYDLFSQVASNIVNLTLIENRMMENVSTTNSSLYFRSLRSLTNHRSDWFQLNSSFYPQLIELDLSFNQWMDEDHFRFDEQFYPQLKSLNFSHNQLTSLNSIEGNRLDQIEILILSFNPLKTIDNRLKEFSSLIHLDLSSTLIRNLLDLRLLPRLEIFHCRQCSSLDLTTLFVNCSQRHVHLRVDFSETPISSMNVFNPWISCFEQLVLNDQNSFDSIRADDLRLSSHLQSIEIRHSSSLEFLYLNIYDRLTSINFNNNPRLNQLNLQLMSNYTLLQSLSASHCVLMDFAIDFSRTKQKSLQIEIIDLSDNRLETIEFLDQLIFSQLDLSGNRLKIIEPYSIRPPRWMNLLNLSSNSIESIRIEWIDQSPHLIDLSNNQLRSVNLTGPTTYVIRFNQNPRLSIETTNFQMNFPVLQVADLTAVNFLSFEQLNSLRNLSDIQTLILDQNRLSAQHRRLKWKNFSPWYRSLKHVSLQNMSIESIDKDLDLMNYPHLLTIDLMNNSRLKCDCALYPFLHWLRVAPPPLPDFYEPLNKVLRLDCPVSIFDLRCQRKPVKYIIFIVFVVLIVILIFIFMLIQWRKRILARSYRRMLTDTDLIALTERNSTAEKIEVVS